MRRIGLLVSAMTAGLLACAFPAGAQVVETVLPALVSGGACYSKVEAVNLGERSVTVAIEAHHPSGALAAWEGQAGNSFRLEPGTKVEVRLSLEEQTTGAWAELREAVPVGSHPVASVKASTECVDRTAVQTVAREAAYPARSPWFAADIDEHSEASILLINTTPEAVTATPCYSGGNLYSMPGQSLKPVCSSGAKVQIAPFGSRTFPTRQQESSHFELRTKGSGIVLQLLRPVPGSSRLFSVDSSVSFENESSAR